ncbi:hypothetical protein HK405_005742 [Cladochytrium tenue]|nr:hypothetical protein HK405_005742 [Cladochytrium tenue]
MDPDGPLFFVRAVAGQDDTNDMSMSTTTRTPTGKRTAEDVRVDRGLGVTRAAALLPLVLDVRREIARGLRGGGDAAGARLAPFARLCEGGDNDGSDLRGIQTTAGISAEAAGATSAVGSPRWHVVDAGPRAACDCVEALWRVGGRRRRPCAHVLAARLARSYNRLRGPWPRRGRRRDSPAAAAVAKRDLGAGAAAPAAVAAAEMAWWAQRRAVGCLLAMARGAARGAGGVGGRRERGGPRGLEAKRLAVADGDRAAGAASESDAEAAAFEALSAAFAREGDGVVERVSGAARDGTAGRDLDLDWLVRTLRGGEDSGSAT